MFQKYIKIYLSIVFAMFITWHNNCINKGDSMHRRIRLEFEKDRDHIAYDILACFKTKNIGIIWMEIYTKDCYIKFELEDEASYNNLILELKKIDDLKSISEVDLISFETRNMELNEIINRLEKIIFVVDCNGIIKYSNISKDFKFVTTETSDLIGKSVFTIIENRELKEIISKQERNDFLLELIFNNKQYLVNGFKKYFPDSALKGYILALENISSISDYQNKKRFSTFITFNDLIYESQKMKDIVNRARDFSNTNLEILITGESGTGKELFTRSIHNLSKRRDKPFIAINCSSLPEQLLESELFGYEAGSFTGGLKEGRAGIFESCNGGTIFLDEIGDMPLHLQAKLLRVLQEKCVRRIGSNREIPVDFRLISATNQDIEELIERDGFRLDLFYRINTLKLNIPPLRQRVEDIEPLVNYFVGNFDYGNSQEKGSFSKSSIRLLENYGFPGNVRELQNIVTRALAINGPGEIEAEDLEYLFENSQVKQPMNFDERVENFEIEIIKKELRKGETIRQTAKNLGMTHTKLINRMKKYNLEKQN